MILVNFERLSLVAPIANVLVVPFVPIAMLFSAIASLAGMVDAALVHPVVIGDALTWLAGGAAWLVLRVIVVLGTSVGVAAVRGGRRLAAACRSRSPGCRSWVSRAGRCGARAVGEQPSAEAGARGSGGDRPPRAAPAPDRRRASW